MLKRLIIKCTILFSLFLAFFVPLYAQTASVAEVKNESKTEVARKEPVETDDMQSRVKQLEAQVQTMQAQIDALKNLINQNQNPQTAVQTENKTNETAKTQTAKNETKQTVSTATAQQSKQLGVDVGSARLTPYGTIYVNGFANSGGTNNADNPLFATPSGTSNASATVRQTRLGVRLEGARVGSARLSGIIETDFFGGIPSVGIGENFGIVRLRLANARLDWEKTSVTLGQDWMVFAPNNPVSIAAATIPQLAAAGNLWARIPQVKVETRLNKNITWQGAVLAPQTGDYPAATSPFFLQPNSGAASRVPFFQSRLSVDSKNLFGTKKPGSFGITGHYGRSRVLTGASANIKNDVDSVGFAADWNLPLGTPRLTLTGEAFAGHNLGGFQAGVFQSYNTDFAYQNGAVLVPGGVRGIGTRGGWAQLGFTPDVFKDRLTLYASIGVDDPRNKDLINTAKRDFRTRNLVYAFDAIYKFTPQFSIGAEFRRFETDYLQSGRREASHFNLGAAYSF